MSDANDQYGEQETRKRMEDALRRALTTPHKLNQAFVDKRAKRDSAKRRKAGGLPKHSKG
jgi:hypothetical protein